MGYKFQIDASLVAAFLLALGGISGCRERPYSGAVNVSLGLPWRWILHRGGGWASIEAIQLQLFSGPTRRLFFAAIKHCIRLF
jgi:hypothetical protein